MRIIYNLLLSAGLILCACDSPAIAGEVPIAKWFNPPAQPLTLLTHESYNSQVMNTKVGYCIYLPPGYSEGEKRYPVVYVLHGRGGNECWDTRVVTELDRVIASKLVRPMILVYPSAGQHTVYCDSVDGRHMADTTVIKELIPHIDATYRTIAKKEGRAIQGMSMGGCGAIKFALKYPDLFSSAIGYAGGFVDAEIMEQKVAMINEGMFGGDVSKWMAEHPYTLAAIRAENVRGKVALRLACGTTDVSFDLTQTMHAALLKANLPHDYLEYAGVEHDFNRIMDVEGPLGLIFADRHFSY
jgi:enterochelin esterase-like enzyme